MAKTGVDQGSPQKVVSQLLGSDTEYPNNLNLLKKIILTSYLGRLRVNGLPPDNDIPLGNYLFDIERIMFDLTRLSEEKKKQFIAWLTESHQKDKQKAWFTGASVNEYRGFTAEVFLSWWGRLVHWFKGAHVDRWKIKKPGLSLDYQLTGVEMCQGEQGVLIGFEQFLVPKSETKYNNPNDNQREPSGNTKRVIITNQLVNLLTKINLKKIDFDAACNNPHPHSISVKNLKFRLNEMLDYRKIQSFLLLKPWYTRLWRWVKSWYEEQPDEKKVKVPVNEFKVLYENETVQILQCTNTKEIQVKEKRPDIDNAVYCGGGAKIYGHIGVWKALNKTNIRPTKFAGTSAGAIMSLLCYLDYSAEEIAIVFANFKQEHLVYFDIDRTGLSNAHSLKTALDYLIAKKIKEVVTRYNIPYPQGKITFATLERIRRQYPHCGFGKELVVTATNKELSKTRYFSWKLTPDLEVSEIVKASASVPVLYKPSTIEDQKYNDGGVLNNFPTGAFEDDHSTLLESEYGNNLKVLAVQFDNGTERKAIDKIMEKVDRENFIWNWVYSKLTGVIDPASAWEKDRLKLRKYALQSIVVDVGNVSSTNFSVEKKIRDDMIQKGYSAARDYLKARYVKNNELNYENREIMYSTFSSLGDLLAYCCYRGDKPWFDIVNKLIEQSKLPDREKLMSQAFELKSLYFRSDYVSETEPNKVTFFGNELVHQQNEEKSNKNPDILLVLYPIFMKLEPRLVVSKADKKSLEYARHSLDLHSPLKCIDNFLKIEGETHILLNVFINYLKELQSSSDETLMRKIKLFEQFFSHDIKLSNKLFYGKWDLSPLQHKKVFELFESGNMSGLSQLISSLHKKESLGKSKINEKRYNEKQGDERLDESIKPSK